MKYFLIMNPRSNGGKSQKKFDRIFTLLKKAKANYDYTFVYTLEEAYLKSVEANKENIDIIVAIGGDGTINNVINGFYDKLGNRVSSSIFAVIYTGTSPDFCKSYDIPTQLDKAIAVLLNAKTIQIPIGKLQYSPSRPKNEYQQIEEGSVETQIQYFACCANIGIGASVARRANGGLRKYFGDFGGTFLSLIISIVKYKANDFTISMDGKKVVIQKLFNLSVGITKYIASGIQVQNTLCDREANFYCLETKGLRFANLPNTLKQIYSGKAIKSTETLSLSYLSHLEIDYNSVNPEVEIDGDPIGFLPCKIEPANHKLDLVC